MHRNKLEPLHMPIKRTGEIPHYELKEMEAGWAETRNGSGHPGNPEPDHFHEEAVTVSVAGNPKKPPTDSSDMVAAGSGGHQNAGTGFNGNLGRRQQIKFFDYNFHSMKKGVSSALLDVALLMANSSQLKSVIISGKNNQPFYEAMITLLVISIVLQVIVGCILIWLSRININEANDKRQNQAEVLNNIVIISIFILTVVNVFTASIGISTPVKGDGTT